MSLIPDTRCINQQENLFWSTKMRYQKDIWTVQLSAFIRAKNSSQNQVSNLTQILTRIKQYKIFQYTIRFLSLLFQMVISVNIFSFQTQRAVKPHLTSTPGAGSYNLPSLLTTRKEFNVVNTSSFHLPIAAKTANASTGTSSVPSPNRYHVRSRVIDFLLASSARAL